MAPLNVIRSSLGRNAMPAEKILEEALAYIRRSRNAHMLRCQLSTREVEGLHQAGAAEQCLESCNSRALRASGSRCPACGWTLEDRRNWPRVQRNGRWEMLWTESVHNNSMGSGPIRSPKVEEVDEFEADAPRRGGRLGMVLGRPAWANVDGVDQRWPVVEAAQFDDAVAKMVFVVAPPVTSHGGQLLFMDFRGRDQSVGASAFAEDLEQVGRTRQPIGPEHNPRGRCERGYGGVLPPTSRDLGRVRGGTALAAPSCEDRGTLSHRHPKTAPCVNRSSLLFAGCRNGDGAQGQVRTLFGYDLDQSLLDRRFNQSG